MAKQIDQSGRCEDTNKPTVMSLANQIIKCLKIKAVEKQKLLRHFRALGYSKKKFAWRLFAALSFLLIKDEKIKSLTIDPEYSGHEANIINTIERLCKKSKIEMPDITFVSIGKKAMAHRAAIAVFRGKREPDLVIKAEHLLCLLSPKKRKPRP